VICEPIIKEKNETKEEATEVNSDKNRDVVYCGDQFRPGGGVANSTKGSGKPTKKKSLFA